MGLMLYRVLAASGGYVNGVEVAIGADVAMTPEEAKYEVDLGNVAPTDRVPVQPPLPPVLLAGDLIRTLRGGVDRAIVIASLEAFLARGDGTLAGYLATRGDEIAVSVAAMVDARLVALRATLDGMLAGTPAELDTFIEIFNRFLRDEGALAALTSSLAAKASAADLALLNGRTNRVDNTRDADKPVSVPQAAAIAAAAFDAATTQVTQELAGPPADLPIGRQRLVWNTSTGRPSLWINRGGTVVDAFDPGTF